MHRPKKATGIKISVSAKFDMIIEPQNQRAYAAAYAKIMSAAAQDVGLRSRGNDLVGFGEAVFTNWVYLGAETLTKLDQIQQALLTHPLTRPLPKRSRACGKREHNPTAVPRGLSTPIAKPSLFDVPLAICGRAKPTRRPP